MNIPFLKNVHLPKLGVLVSFSPASYVGIDIGSDSAKVVQLKKERERAVLETYGELKTARYFEKEKSRGTSGFLRHNEETLKELLRDVLRESNVTTKRAVFSISSVASFITPMSMPYMTREELEQAVPFEARKYIPIPTQEVTLDWQVIEQSQAQNRVTVLLAAVPQEVIGRYQSLGASAGLEMEAIEIESFSLARSLLSKERGAVALVNLGALATTLTIIDQQVIRINHNFGRGSQEITNGLSRSLGVNEERAELLKREIGLSTKAEEKEITDIISSYVDALFTDVERVMTSYNQEHDHKIEKIVLTGGGAGLNGLANHVAQRFGLEASVGNPFNRTTFPEFLQPVLKNLAPNFGVAVGLALRPIMAQ